MDLIFAGEQLVGESLLTFYCNHQITLRIPIRSSVKEASMHDEDLKMLIGSLLQKFSIKISLENIVSVFDFST